ncbi:type II toxin-antitoxin system RelE/ParE family toxin [Gemmatimonas sp.]|uniref:type II toxin-antitoxin system RelE/ParE family toxin n=1 Tax=Gemmatimonas sp. TaxID=1962908 RepID=UPI0035659004
MEAPPLTFHQEALVELRDAVRYYGARLPQLGADFVAEVRRVTALVVLRPHAGEPMARGRRRWRCERFPYAAVYRVAPDGSIRVLAVAHHRRRPGYWRARTQATTERMRGVGARPALPNGALLLTTASRIAALLPSVAGRNLLKAVAAERER